MKKFAFIICCVFLLSLFLAGVSYAGANKLCPIPKALKFKINGTTYNNAAMPSGITNGNITKCLTESTVTDTMPLPTAGATNGVVVVEEDQPVDVKVVCIGADGAEVAIDDVKVGDKDETTRGNSAEPVWQPDHLHGPGKHDASAPCSCYKAPRCSVCGKTGEDHGDSHKWSDTAWEISKIDFAYNLDSPAKFSTDGTIGNNDTDSQKEFKEFHLTGSGQNAASPGSFKYFVPSVPMYYAATAVLTFKWKWNSNLQHVWKLQSSMHKDEEGGGEEGDEPDGKCDNCGCQMSSPHPSEQLVNWSQSSWEFSPELFLTRQIEEMHDADKPIDRIGVTRTGSLLVDYDPAQYVSNNPYIDLTGPTSNKIYKNKPELGNPGVSFPPGGEKTLCVVARVLVMVKDKRNIAHVQSGVIADKSNVIKAKNGQRISKTDSRKITVRVVDNNPHQTYATVGSGSGCANLTECDQAGFNDNKFRMVFWYEWPVYQYASFWIGDEKIKNTTGGFDDVPCFNTMYSPMFVWKKGLVINKFSDFINSDANVFKNYTYTKKGTTADTKDPEFVVYERTFTLEELLKNSESGKEDFMGWHYAKTSLGDSFGNPCYEDATKPVLGRASYKDAAGADVTFAHKPMQFTNRKGPLKYFFEFRDCSGNGCGKIDSTKPEDKQLKALAADSADETNSYFKSDVYTQGQLKCNPAFSKFMYAPDSTSGAAVAEGADVDPIAVAEGDYLKSEDYNYNDDTVQGKWKECDVVKNNMLNTNDSTPEYKNDAAKILENFQAWGIIDVEDKINPNIGLRIENKVNKTVRIFSKWIGLEKLSAANAEIFDRGGADKSLKKWSMIDLPKKDRFNYYLAEKVGADYNNVESSDKLPYCLNSTKPDGTEDAAKKEWVFSDVPLDTVNNKIFQGSGNMGYGIAENVPMVVRHEDLSTGMACANGVNFTTYRAHDNIDGQRLMQASAADTKVDKTFWYKGVISLDKYYDPANTIPTPYNYTLAPMSFNGDKLEKGFYSWIIIDKTYPDDETRDKVYKIGGSYAYPTITFFNNPNCNWKGDALPSGEKDIALAFGVTDRNNNVRQLRIKCYVAPTDTKILTIEKTEKRND